MSVRVAGVAAAMVVAHAVQLSGLQLRLHLQLHLHLHVSYGTTGVRRAEARHAATRVRARTGGEVLTKLKLMLLLKPGVVRQSGARGSARGSAWALTSHCCCCWSMSAG